MGSWYEVARFPNKKQKDCASNGTELYALGYKPRTFQVGTFCKLVGGTYNEWGANGKTDKSGDGTLKIKHLVFFSTTYRVLALGPGYQWALIGTPNHKSLWILSRSRTLDPGLLSSVESTASAQGFDTSKLIMVAHTGDERSAESLATGSSTPDPNAAAATKPAGSPSSPQTTLP